MFNSILVVTDFSPNSLKAVNPAIELARKFSATILLCHVDEEEQALSAHSSDELVEFLHTVEVRRASWLESLANQIREHDVACEIVRLKGWASKEILRYSEEARVDMVAISALGGQGFKALLMGSTSTNVLRNSKKPTLFISAHCAPKEDFQVQAILYPTDFSPASIEGARFAARMCRDLGARLDMFHVMKLPSFIPALPGEPPLVMPPRLLNSMDRGFEVILDGIVDLVPPDSVSCELTMGEDEAEAISAAAIAKKVDLVVIPRRGQGVLDGLLFGRVAENVARTCPVPTIIFEPAPAEQVTARPT